MNITMIGRVTRETYNAATDSFAPSMTLYELKIKADEGDDTDAIADRLNAMQVADEIFPTEFDDSEWGFTGDNNEWEFELDAAYLNGLTPVEYMQQRLS